MPRIFFDVMEYSAALDVAVDSAMDSFVKEKAIEIVQEAIEDHVYSAHDSQFSLSPKRRGKRGGIQAKENLEGDYSDLTLTITEVAKWQHRFDKNVAPPSTDLGDVIEKNGMYGAGARPFMRDAEVMAKDKLESVLQTALLFEGF